MINVRQAGAARMMAAALAGGAAEVLWIVSIAAILGSEASSVARGITATVFPALAESAAAPWVGLAVHFALSLVVVFAFAKTIGRLLRGAAVYIGAAVVTAFIWAVNFLVLLPMLNPAFPQLLPYPVTFISKILFGLAMAAVLTRPDSAGRRWFRF